MSKKKKGTPAKGRGKLDYTLLAEFFPDPSTARSLPKRAVESLEPKTAEELYSKKGRKVKGNHTPFPAFNKVAKHPLVTYVDYEGPDGFWAYLIEGYNWEGRSCVHEWDLDDVMSRLDEVEKGDPH